MPNFLFEGLDRLSERVARGEVVFFIGAGFSLDSEGNSTPTLMRRLLSRLLAMGEILRPEAPKKEPLVESFCNVFQLKGYGDSEEIVSKRIASDENVQKLSQDYYGANDWCTSAFGELIDELAKLAEPLRSETCERIASLELDLHSRLLKSAKTFESKDFPPFPRGEELCRLLDLDQAVRGKALFLETLGFADERIMSGEPMSEREERVSASYRAFLSPKGELRLLDRHFVLAWMAREGFCPTLVTTNYDLLLEGAYRLTGFQPFHKARADPSDSDLLGKYFTRIAGAEEFFAQGASHRPALILKIHGCAGRYREARKTATEWPQSLPAVVFTYREIQNWRQDGWSRDLLRTLIRTRTLVFAGYRASDQVIHDTLRTVYEEMAQRRRAAVPKQPAGEPEQAPAFYFGLSSQKEFHALEILRAASTAAGCRSSLAEHPNLLPFYRSEDGRFPNLDESLLWLFHRTFRRQQEQALKEKLRQTSWIFFEHPGAPTDLNVIESRFAKLCESEKLVAQKWTDEPSCRAGFRRQVGWTTQFQAALLREWALADKAQRKQGPGFNLQTLRRSPWYQPASEHWEWTAWGAVLEIALRRAIAHWRGTTEPWYQDVAWVRPGGSRAVPRILFSRERQSPCPIALTLQLTAFERSQPSVEAEVGLRSNVLWRFRPSDLPWRREESPRYGSARLPSARQIWRWASGGDESLEEFASFLETPDG